MSIIRNKQRLFHLYRYLLKYTDEEHQASTNDLVKLLREMDAHASRKTVKDDIEVLAREGVDVITTKSYYNSFFIGSRQFEVPEIKILTDAVAANESLTSEQKRKLIDKLLSQLSVHQAEKLEKAILFSEAHGENEQLYYHVDKITDAICEGKKVKILCFDQPAAETENPKEGAAKLLHNVRQKLPGGGGKTHILTPVAITCRDNCFYLIGRKGAGNEQAAFRLDRIAKTTIIE